MQLVVPRGGDGTTSADGRGLRLVGVTGWLRRRGLIPDEPRPGIAPPAPLSAAETVLETALDDTGRAAVLPLAESLERTRVRVRGTVGEVRVRTRSGWPRLEAELDDGSAKVLLVWLGRRRIAGVEPGGTLVASGTLAHRSGRRVIFNPSYELVP